MDDINSFKANKYVMSLDTLDLALLPITYTSKFNKTGTSLWTVDNIHSNSNDYFQFELNPQSNAIKFKDEHTLNNDTINNYQPLQCESNPSMLTKELATTTCHICDIEVPLAYLVEHENSLKHKAYVKIANVVLDRTRKHIVRKNTGTVQKNDSLYFCGPCAYVVQVNNKHSHEKSKVHKQAVSLDRLLNDLLALYTDEVHKYDEEKNFVINNKTFDNNQNDLKTNIAKNIDNNTVVICDIKARFDELKINSSDYYIKVMDDHVKDKSYTLSCKDNDVRISMQDGFDVIVAMDNFNGFLRIGENFILCIVCKVIVEDEKVHKVSDTHIKNIIIPFEDHHCLRNLNNSVSHCVICNKIVEDSKLHILYDDNHKEFLEKCLEVLEKKPSNETNSTVYKKLDNDSHFHIHPRDGACDNQDIPLTVTENKPMTNEYKPNVKNVNNDTYNCDTCNLTMHVNNIESHINGTKHAMCSKSKVHYQMKQIEGSNNLLCRVCNTYIADDTNQVMDHVETTEHCRKYKDLLHANYIMRQKGEFYCKPCDIVVPKMSELFHIEKLNHQDKSASVREIKANSDTNEKSNIKDTNGNNSGSLLVPTSYFCEICNVHIPNNPFNITGHNNGMKHNKNVSKAQKIAEVADSIETSSSVSASLDIHYQMDATENEKNLTCKVCKVIIPNIEDSIMQHITGKKHEASLKNIMEVNHIECAGEQYYCKACALNINPEKLFIHINLPAHLVLSEILENNLELVTNEHLEMYSQGTSNTEKDEDKIKNTDNIDQNTDSEGKLYLQYKYHFLEKEDKKWLQCNICCNIDIPNTAKSVAIHATGQAHEDGYNNLKYDNLIFETENSSYLCGICMCLVPLKGEIHHVKGLRHKENYIKSTNAKHCDICEVNMSHIDMAGHLITLDHMNRLLKKQQLLHYCKFCEALTQKSKADEHASNCHKLAVKDKICFCTICDPFLPVIKKK